MAFASLHTAEAKTGAFPKTACTVDDINPALP